MIYPPAVDESLEDRAVRVLAAVRDARRALDDALATKRALFADVATAQGSKRAVPRWLRSLLQERGWSEADVRRVGIGPGATRPVLDRL